MMKKLSESEWKIMTALWENGSLTISKLTSLLKEETGWSKNTVITLLNRMEDKQAVSYDYISGARHYRSLISRDDVALSETESFLKRMYSGSLGLMVNAMIREKALSKEEIAELSRLLRAAEEPAEQHNEKG